MKINKLTDEQLRLMAYTEYPDSYEYMAVNHPEYMAVNHPEYMAVNHPEYIQDIIK